MSLMYNNYVKVLADRAEKAFSEITAVHNFDYGDEFEVAVCKLLRLTLPNKYGVCRGFVVDRDGEEAGDDVIIFDRHMFPTLRALPEEDYSRKEHVPIEAVYAYIECKHTLIISAEDPQNSLSLHRASNQVSKVKALCAKRKQRGLGSPDTYISMPAIDHLAEREYLPQYRNPPFGMIFSRRAALTKSSNITTDHNKIHSTLLTASDIKKNDHAVDVVIAGSSNLMTPGYITADNSQNNCLFMLPQTCKPAYGCFTSPEHSVGIGLCHLLAVLDWIRLGRLPWEDMLNQAKHGRLTD